MKKIFILIICLSLLASCSLFRDNCDDKISYTSVYFLKNGRINERLILAISDSTTQLPLFIKSLNNEIPFFRNEICTNSFNYLRFLDGLKLIDSIQDSCKFEKTEIMIDIIKKDTLVDIYRFKNKAQFKKYIELSDEIFGNKNYVPIRDCLEELK